MKLWHTPSLEELNVNATAYAVGGGSHVDGAYQNTDGSYTRYTYASSSGNNGVPGLHDGPNGPEVDVVAK